MDDEFIFGYSYVELEKKYNLEFNQRKTKILIDTLRETILLIKDADRGNTMNSLYSEALELQKELRQETKVHELIGMGKSTGIDYLGGILLNLDDFIDRFKMLCAQYNISIFENDISTRKHFLFMTKDTSSKLYPYFIKKRLIPGDTSQNHFDFAFLGGDRPQDFKPINWIGSKEEARIIFTKFKNPDIIRASMIKMVPASNCFMYKGELLRLANNKSRKNKAGEVKKLSLRTQLLESFLDTLKI